MGSSKIVLVGATSLIVGIYALSIKNVESSYVATSMKRVQTVQADRLAEAGMRFALNKIADDNGTLKKLTKTGKTVGDGVVNYDISNGTASSADLTVTVNIGAVTKTVTAHVEKVTGAVKKGLKSIHRGQWVVTKYYVQQG